MRLGAYEAALAGNSRVASFYGTTEISERHRHRYEVNVHYREALEQGGLLFTGMSPACPGLDPGARYPKSSSARTTPGSSTSSSTRS